MTKTALTRRPWNDPGPGFDGELNQVVAFGEHLIDAEGMVIGVNTAVVSQHQQADGPGVAIYAARIRGEFARDLGGKI